MEYLLGDGLRPVQPDRGILLTESYRMNAPVCAFISDTMYDGRLRPAPGRELQRVDSPGLTGQGLMFLAVEHKSVNRLRSIEEAERIAEEIALLLGGTVIDHDGERRPITPDDIVVVTPYNAQVRRIKSTLNARGGALAQIQVGTVDKFQGREAHVVFFSTAASTVEDAPRGVSFLFDRNRFNVAISRAKSLAVLVASPELLTAACSTVEQARCMNAVLSFKERSETHW